MGQVGTAEYDVLISRAKVQAEVAAASRQIEAGFGQSARKVESQFAATARAAVAGFAVLKGGQFLNDSVQAASNLAEAQTKATVVFGDSIAKVEEFGESSAKSIGQSQRQALEAAGTFGNLFRAIGLSEAQSADFSVTLTKLASDLASFNNTSVDEALTALRSGLVGETEPLKRFGVNLNEVTLKAKALALGLSDGKGVLDANAKAQAAYAIILEQTALAQGDFERTSDGLANKKRIEAAEYENARAELGEGLLPVMKQATDIGIVMARTFSALPEPLQLTAVAAGGLVLAVGLFGPAVSRGVASITGWVGAQGASAVATTAATRSIDGQTAALLLNEGAARKASASRALLGSSAVAGTAATVGLGVAILGVTKIMDDEQRKVADLAKETEDWAAIVDEVANMLANAPTPEQGLDDVIVDFIGDNPNILESLGIDAPTLQAELEKGAASFQQFLYDLYYSGASVDADEAAALSGLALSYDQAKGKAEALRKAKEDLAGASKELAGLTDEEKQAAIEAFDAEQDAARAATEARGDTLRAFDELQTAQRAAAGDSEEYAQAQQRVRDAERDVADAQRDVLRAQEDLTDARKRAAETLEDLRFAAEGAALSEERAQLRLADAIAAEAETLADPLATDRDKQEASLTRREAELALREAQDRRGDSAADLAEADRKGIEGSDEVVAAKERVADAVEAQGEAETRAADAARDAAEVLEAARARVVEAEANLTEAILDQADAEGDLAEALGSANGGLDAKVGALGRVADALEPGSRVRRNVEDFRRQLEELRDTLYPEDADPYTSGGTGVPGFRYPDQAPPEPVGAANGPGRSLGAGSGGGVTQNFYANDFDEKALGELAGKAASDAGMGWGG